MEKLRFIDLKSRDDFFLLKPIFFRRGSGCGVAPKTTPVEISTTLIYFCNIVGCDFKIIIRHIYCKALYKRKFNFYQEMTPEHQSQEVGRSLIPLYFKAIMWS